MFLHCILIILLYSYIKSFLFKSKCNVEIPSNKFQILNNKSLKAYKLNKKNKAYKTA